jgi:molecular chaperone GrpE
MSDGGSDRDESIPLATPEPLVEIVPDVAFVVPAAVYDSIATDDELALRAEPRDARLAEGDRAILAAVAALGEAVDRRLDALHTRFDRELRAEATREKVVDRLHAELQEYKHDLLLNVLRPIFIDLVQLHDDIGKMAVAHGEGGGDPTRLAAILQGFQQGIEDILYRQGVEPFEHPGAVFDPRRQRAVATVPTDDAACNKAIAARLRKGFHTIGAQKVIRPEIVSVFAYKSPAPGG